MAGIFISYRREDSIAYAGRLFDRLRSHFGDQSRVFMDVDTIQPGEDFIERIKQTVTSCDVLIAVIGKQWLSSVTEQGQVRLADPEDFVHLEIRTALDRKVRVIPALVGGARMPGAQELPAPLAALSRRHAIEISDISFHDSAARLIAAVEKAIAEAEQKRTPPELRNRSKEGVLEQVANKPERVISVPAVGGAKAGQDRRTTFARFNSILHRRWLQISFAVLTLVVIVIIGRAFWTTQEREDPSAVALSISILIQPMRDGHPTGHPSLLPFGAAVHPSEAFSLSLQTTKRGHLYVLSEDEKAETLNMLFPSPFMYSGSSEVSTWDPLESTCRHASLSIL